MHDMARLIRLAAATAVLGGAVAAVAQPMGPGGAGAGPGMMGPGPGLGRGFTDPAGYLDALKTGLGVTSQQEPAWRDYADTVQGVATQMQGAHQIMYEAMGTATWEERRDMMNRMFEARQQAFTTVHEAAQKLLPSLTPAQRTLASTCLPGLRVPRRGMMGMMRPGAPT